jgi:hypothetical protein
MSYMYQVCSTISFELRVIDYTCAQHPSTVNLVKNGLYILTILPSCALESEANFDSKANFGSKANFASKANFDISKAISNSKANIEDKLTHIHRIHQQLGLNIGTMARMARAGHDAELPHLNHYNALIALWAKEHACPCHQQSSAPNHLLHTSTVTSGDQLAKNRSVETPVSSPLWTTSLGTASAQQISSI